MNEKMPKYPSELDKIQRANLSDEQIAKDKDRENVYNAGRKHQQIIDVVKTYELSEEAEKALFNDDVAYNQGAGFFHPHKPLPEELMLEFILKLPRIDVIDVGSNEVINLNIVRKFWGRFPEGKIHPYGDFDGRNLLDELDEKMVRWGEPPKKVLDFVKKQILNESKK